MASSNHDDARDAGALMCAYITNDVEAAKTIHHNCDPEGTLTVMTVIAAELLIRAKGKDGARAALARFQRRNTGGA